jgi:hypothetical protein
MHAGCDDDLNVAVIRAPAMIRQTPVMMMV